MPVANKVDSGSMTINVLFVVAGLVTLIIAGDVLVRGAVNLSLRLGIPALVVSLTVVAFLGSSVLTACQWVKPTQDGAEVALVKPAHVQQCKNGAS